MIAIDSPKTIYWHRELPPLDAESVGEHTIDVNSRHVPDTIAHHEELWSECKDDMMVHLRERLTQEIARLGGRCVHVLSESINSKRDPVSGEAWLHGRFTYVLYR